jgi:hypothetical protein
MTLRIQGCDPLSSAFWQWIGEEPFDLSGNQPIIAFFSLIG